MKKVLFFILALVIMNAYPIASAADSQYERPGREDWQREKLKHQESQRDNSRLEDSRRENFRQENYHRDRVSHEESPREVARHERSQVEVIRREESPRAIVRHEYSRREGVRQEAFRRGYPAYNLVAAVDRRGYDRIDYQPAIPYGRYETREIYQRDDYYYPVERVHYRHVERSFPVFNPYGWYSECGRDFWYRGEHVTNAAVFYDDSDEFVSIGFWQDGSFVMVRDDETNDDNSSSFFLMYSNLEVPGEGSGAFVLI